MSSQLICNGSQYFDLRLFTVFTDLTIFSLSNLIKALTWNWCLIYYTRSITWEILSSMTFSWSYDHLTWSVDLILKKHSLHIMILNSCVIIVSYSWVFTEISMLEIIPWKYFYVIFNSSKNIKTCYKYTKNYCDSSGY